MKFKVAAKLQYAVKDVSTLIFNISASNIPSQNILEESLHMEPHGLGKELFSYDNNRAIRIVSDKTNNLIVKYNALVHHKHELINSNNLFQVSVSELPAEILPYLLPSRYCQSDKLIRLAQDKFGKINHVFDQVMEICNWIRKNVEYVSGSTGSDTSAFDTVTQREGVCRDFAHLGIALCRALTIPARYLSCYAYQLNPPDFHACFEAYLGGKWIAFDPTQLAPINGLIKVGTGRDATDISVATIYGNVNFKSMEVSCEVQDENFQPLYLKDLKKQGICL